MGFQYAPVRRLAYESPEFEGLEVDTLLPTVRQYQQASRLLPLDPGDPARADETAELFDLLAELIDSWNYEDREGRPVPVSAEAFHEMPKPMVVATCNAWVDAVVGIPAPLPETSADGSSAGEIPMTPIDQAS